MEKRRGLFLNKILQNLIKRAVLKGQLFLIIALYLYSYLLQFMPYEVNLN